jgi:arabinan endo-1,5-alpha-L-arabinosidase
MAHTSGSLPAAELPSIPLQTLPDHGRTEEQPFQAAPQSTCLEIKTSGYADPCPLPFKTTAHTYCCQAPDVAQVGNQYYLYYSVSTFGSQNSAIGIARSTSLDAGTWTDLGSTGVVSNPSLPYNAIDGNLVNEEGTSNYFLTFGSFWQGIHRVRVTPTKQHGSPYQVAFDPRDPAIEGPTVFKNGEFYYLFFSKGSCCGYDRNRPPAGKEYRIMVCRSTSPVGPFVDKQGRSCRDGGGTLVLGSHDWVYGPGGQGVYRDPVLGLVSFRGPDVWHWSGGANL